MRLQGLARTCRVVTPERVARTVKLFKAGWTPEGVARDLGLPLFEVYQLRAAAKYRGLTGDIAFDATGQSRPALFLTQVKGGKQVVVAR